MVFENSGGLQEVWYRWTPRVHSRANAMVREGGSHSKLPSPIQHQGHRVKWKTPKGEPGSHPTSVYSNRAVRGQKMLLSPACSRGLLHGQDPRQTSICSFLGVVFVIPPGVVSAQYFSICNTPCCPWVTEGSFEATKNGVLQVCTNSCPI